MKKNKPVVPATEKQVFSLLGLCARQGAVKSGEFSADQAIKEGKAKLVIVAEDASDNTKKAFKNACEYYQVPLRIFAAKTELGHCIGREFRASAAVTNEGLAKKILETIDELHMRGSLSAEGEQEGK